MDEHPMRRHDDVEPQHVVVDAVGRGTKRLYDHGLALLFGVFLATLISIPSTLWAGSGWVARMEVRLDNLTQAVETLGQEIDETRTVAAQKAQGVTDAVAAIDKTMTRVVTNQENLQLRVERLERKEDAEHLE